MNILKFACHQNHLTYSTLYQGLNDLKARLNLLSGKFKPGADIGGFAPVFAALLIWISEIWNEFQMQGCKALQDAQMAFREAKQFSSDAINAVYATALDEAKKKFVEAVRLSAGNFASRNRERFEALVQAQTALPQIKRELWLHVIKMTGSDKTIVQPVNYDVLTTNFRKWFYAILVIEVVLGMFVFELKSNRLFAIAIAVGVALATMFSRDKASEAKSLINGWEDAVRNFRTNYPNGVKDFSGNRVQLYGLSRTIRETYYKAELTYWLTSLTVLAWRCYVSYTDPAAGSVGVFGSLMVIGISSVYGWVMKYPVYQRELQEKWQKLVDSQAAAEGDITYFSKPDVEDPFKAEVAQAKCVYFTDCFAANVNVDKDLAGRRNTARELVETTAQYEQAFSGARSSYESMWPQAAAMCTENPDSNVFANAANSRAADELFEGMVRASLNDANLLDEARNFAPKVHLIAQTLSTEALDEIAEVEEAQAQTKNAASGMSGQALVVKREVV